MKDQLEYLNEYIQSRMQGANWAIKLITEKKAMDFGIDENTTEEELEEIGREVIDSEHEALCEAKEAWRYEH